MKIPKVCWYFVGWAIFTAVMVGLAVNGLILRGVL